MSATLAVAVIIVGTILFRAPALGNPVHDFDEQLYSLIGQRWVDGLLPYADSWDRKPPGLFAIFALSHWLGGPSAVAYQIPALVAAIAGSLIMYALSRPFVARGQAALVALSYSLGMVLFGSASAQSEVFFVPLLLGALLLLTEERPSRRRAVAAMLLLGLALQVKYTVLPVCVMLGAYALVRRWQGHGDRAVLLQDALLFTAAGLAPTLAFFAYFAAQGEFAAFWHANFVSFFGREGAGRWHDPTARAFCILAVPALEGLLVAALTKAVEVPRQYPLYILFWVAALVTVLFPATVYSYYFATLLPASLLLALPLFRLKRPIGLLCQLVYLAIFLNAWIASHPVARAAADRLAVAELADTIRPHVDEDRCLFIYDGPAALYRLTGACIPTRFVYPDHLNNRLERNALGTPQLGELAGVIRSRPQVIVSTQTSVAPLSRENDRMVETALRRDYRRVRTVMLQDREIAVWLLRNGNEPRSSDSLEALPVAET